MILAEFCKSWNINIPEFSRDKTFSAETVEILDLLNNLFDSGYFAFCYFL